DQMEPNNPFYNIVTAVRLRGRLDVTAVRQSVNEIVRRHETLRTTFTIADGLPVQVINPASPLAVPLTDLGEWPEATRESEVRRLVREEAGASFNLARGPLLRVSV